MEGKREPFDREAISRLKARSKRNEQTGCLEWQGRKADGYGTVQYRGRHARVHRLSYIAHNGPIPDGLFVCHKCDNRACHAIEHLFLGSAADNAADMRKKGRQYHGQETGRYRAIITREMAAEIKRRILRGESGPTIVRELPQFPLNLGIVGLIRRGVTWRDVDPSEGA